MSRSFVRPDALAAALRPGDIASEPRYIHKPAFECAVVRDHQTFGGSWFSFTLARPEALDYSRARYLGVYDLLEHVIVLPWNERFGAEKTDRMHRLLAALSERCSVHNMGDFASRIAKGRLPLRAPDFGHQRPGEPDASQVVVESR